MALPSNADIPRILGVGWPDTAWGFLGENKSLYSNLDWRDVALKPSEAEMESVWTDIVASDAATLSVKQALKANINAVAGAPVANMSNAELAQMVEVLMTIMGGVDLETRNVNTANKWKQGRQILDV